MNPTEAMIKYMEKKHFLVKEEFDLKRCANNIKVDQKSLWETIKIMSDEIFEIRKEIKPFAKKNHELEVEVETLDKMINKLLQEHNKHVYIKGLENTQEKKTEDGILKNREDYEKMFYVLQTNPDYFASIAPKVHSRDMYEFANTIIFDTYGDQFDSREERLLLLLFQKIIKDEFGKAGEKCDMCTLFRANTTITVMLTQYARREGGMSALKKVLEQPIQEMLSNPKLNLEINPHKVYQELIKEYEQKTQKAWK